MNQPEASDPKYQEGAPPSPDELHESIIISPDTHRSERIPPGQVRTKKWPVLHAHDVPFISQDQWEFKVFGLVENELKFNWNEYCKLPRSKVFSDFHCVTTWSRLGNLWEGVLVKNLMQMAGILPEAKFVIITGYDYGWTTNLPLNDFLSADVLIADQHDGEPINADHGGPCRLIVPKLYAWKSAKWIRSIELVTEDAPGYWEQLGYHNHGDPWTEERME